MPGTSRGLGQLMKRFLDVSGSLLVLVVLLPLLCVLALAVRFDSPGPALFRQQRIGLRGRRFVMYKFRTMRDDAPHDVPTHLLPDARSHVTRVGRVLRRTSLDELPQVLNILKGDMSFVGPRPALWNQGDLIEARARNGANNLPPGLTGWAQINGRDELSIADKAALDGYYVEHQSLLFDLRCLVGTVASVIHARGVAEESTATREGVELNSEANSAAEDVDLGSGAE